MDLKSRETIKKNSTEKLLEVREKVNYLLWLLRQVELVFSGNGTMERLKWPVGLSLANAVV